MIRANHLMLSFLLLGLASCTDHQSISSLQVQDGFTVELAAGSDLVDYPMFATLDPTGRLFVFESVGDVYETSQQAMDDPVFRIKLLEDVNADGEYDKATIFADRLSFPQGGVFVDGSLIASSAPDLLKLTDTDGDGVADEKEVLLTGFTLNVNANSLIGPFLGPDGWLYMTSAIEGFDVVTKEGARVKGETARIWKVRPDGRDLQWISAGGMNNPVELTFTPAGEVLGTQTFFVDPQRGLRDAITYWTEGGIYGKKNSSIDRDSLPRTGGLLPVVSQYSRVAPVGITLYQSNLFGEEFENNLFSTTFNTHEVIRHRLTREGASFTLTDQRFLWTEDTDFHPTDVLEDGDGSLLVVETGGWFIKGCPLSQVSKPQLKGSIYRIRKQQVKKVEDPYGNQIDWNSLDNATLRVYLEDPRPFVSARSQKQLIKQGNSAVEIFNQVLRESTSVPALLKAVFGFYQVGTDQARTLINAGFDHESLEVQLATVRVAGLLQDERFLPKLTPLLSASEPALARQAATAIGQIGSAQSVKALMGRAGTAQDPFVQHAITYALISLDNPQTLVSALGTASVPLKKSILLSLEYMPSYNVSQDLIFPWLEEGDLNETILQVAARHPEWAPGLLDYLEARLLSDVKPDTDLQVYNPLLVNYCETPEMQGFLIKMIRNGNSSMKAQALQSMGLCSIEPFPERWESQIRETLQNETDPGTLHKAVSLVKMRGLDLSESLLNIAQNPARPASLRIAAIDALLSSDRQLSDSNLSFLCDQFAGTSPIIAQQAARTLALADLTEDQLSAFTSQQMPELDPFLVPRVLPIYEGVSDPEIGEKLASYLIKLQSLDNFTEPYLRDLFSGFPEQTTPWLEQLLSKLSEVKQQRYQNLVDLEVMVQGGSEERGRALYFGKALCSTCHTMNEGGGAMGPDLTSIQKDRSVHDIIEAIVYPSVSLVREYETYKIITGSDEFRGIIKEQTPEVIFLETAPETTVRIPSVDILSIEQLHESMMPPGLDKQLTTEEFKDLMAYLLGKDLEY